MRSSRSSRWIVIRYGGLLSSLCLLATLWMGCTAQRRYKTLSFFFDGVPDPANAQTVNGKRVRVGPGGATSVSFVHKPYGEGNCAACHSSGTDSIFRTTEMKAIESSVCLKCHQKTVNQYAVMHGPVSAVECLRCHTPHESNTEHLLATASPRVCVQCHVPELLSPNPPEHYDKKADCLTCHNAHGGEKHGLLKPGIKFAPTTLPAFKASNAMLNVDPAREPK